MSAQSHGPTSIPEATVGRLPIYLRALVEMAQERRATVSSESLAEQTGVTAAKVRKDLSYLGNYGTRGVGYEVQNLLDQISRELGLTMDWPVAIFGIGNLGHALANYKGFEQRGFRIVAVFDADERKVGEPVAGLKVRHIRDLPRVAAQEKIAIALIATPAVAAQEVADAIVAAGIHSILNFAPVVLNVPKSISIRRVDLSIELQILSFYEHRTRSSAAPRKSG